MHKAPYSKKLLDLLYSKTNRPVFLSKLYKIVHSCIFNILKKKLIFSLIIIVGFTDYNKSFIAYCDSSKLTLSASLLREKNSVIKTINYGSRNFKPHEQNYNCYELETAAVAFGCAKFISFLEFNFTTVCTGCTPLLPIFQHKKLSRTKDSFRECN